MISREFWKKIKLLKINKPVDNLEKFIVDKNRGNKLVEIKKISQVYKSFKSEKVIFENLSFDIYEGDRLALIGANGCGKTTIVELICGFKNATAGEIEYNFGAGVNPYKSIGVQFQDLSFPRNLTVKSVIDFVVKLDGTSIDEIELEKMLIIFSLNSLLDTKAHKLSGGQQQRLNVILSLLSKPKLLFLDEFTTGLDIAVKKNIKDFIISFCEKYKITYVMISHDIETMKQMVNRTIVIHDKEIYVDASIEDVNKKFGSIFKMVDQYIK
ncbi:MAG: ATP-binding cassette domain-containing protein [Mycoplasmoidaceae bacterium]